MRIGIITFPGSLDDRDAQRAVRLAGETPVALWHGDHDLQGVDAIILPGGFSYGDYLRAGAIASHAPIMAEVIDAAGRGVPVLGICNGFQVLCEAGLLPGALLPNDHLKFVFRQVNIPESAASQPTENPILRIEFVACVDSHGINRPAPLPGDSLRLEAAVRSELQRPPVFRHRPHDVVGGTLRNLRLDFQRDSHG